MALPVAPRDATAPERARAEGAGVLTAVWTAVRTGLPACLKRAIRTHTWTLLVLAVVAVLVLCRPELLAALCDSELMKASQAHPVAKLLGVCSKEATVDDVMAKVESNHAEDLARSDLSLAKAESNHAEALARYDLILQELRGARPKITRKHVQANDAAAISALIHVGADPNVRWNDSASHPGATPLYYAVFLNRLGVAKALLAGGAEVDYPGNTYGDIALFPAVLQGNDALVRLLLNHGANSARRNSGGAPPLQMALLVGHASTALLLLEDKRAAEVVQFSNDNWNVLACVVLSPHLANADKTKLLTAIARYPLGTAPCFPVRALALARARPGPQSLDADAIQILQQLDTDAGCQANQLKYSSFNLNV